MSRQVFRGPAIEVAEVIVGAVYEGESTKRNEPISRLLGPGVSNSSGFRKCYQRATPKGHRGRRSRPEDLAFVAVYTSGRDLDWPDAFDEGTGTFTYFGDNKRPGHELHDTDKGGNWLLRGMWEGLATGTLARADVPPLLVFRHAGMRQDVEFVGLAVPGVRGAPLEDCLVALWRSTEGHPFQNYRAQLTILDCASVSREWIEDLKSGHSTSENAPPAWQDWVRTSRYSPRVTVPTVRHRTRCEQLPETVEQARIVSTIRRHYAANPYGFERLAAALVLMAEPGRVTAIAVTQPRRDGGRDAVGSYRIGFGIDPIDVEFAVEAKCTTGPVGVKEVARLISRMRHRQFGVLVTTSYVAEQAYKEIKEDGHPVAILAARDIAETLIRLGYAETARLEELMRSADDEGGDLLPLPREGDAPQAAEAEGGYGS